MTVTIQYFDAGHAYSIDNVPATAAQVANLANVLGTITDVATPWSGPAQIGKLYTGVVTYSSGFTGSTSLTLVNSTTVNVSNVTLTAPNHEVIYRATGNLIVSAAAASVGLSDATIFSGDDNIVGNSYNNLLKGYAGNDRIDGGAGTDTALYSGYKSQYQITRNGLSITVSGPEGTDTLVNVERVQFADRGIAFDTDGASGQAYRLYQAAFNRKPDLGGLGFYFDAMNNGMSLTDVAQHFIDSPEFVKTYGQLNATQFVTQLYANVLHRAPDAAGLAYHVDHLDHGLAQNQLLVQFSESPENQATLIGAIKGGMEYIV